MDLSSFRCWKCSRLTFPWNCTASKWNPDFWHGKWPEGVPPPGSLVCGRCRLPVIEEVAKSGGPLYHLMRSSKDLSFVMRLATVATPRQLNDTWVDGLRLYGGTFTGDRFDSEGLRKYRLCTVSDFLNGLASASDIDEWGGSYGSNATAAAVADLGWSILLWLPIGYSTAVTWDLGWRDVRLSEGALRIHVQWGRERSIHEIMLVALRVPEDRYFWFRQEKSWASGYR
jgi:hypothetical protein